MGNGDSTNQVQARQIDELLAFPVLTREIGGQAPSAAGTPSAPGSAPFAQIVEGTLRNVLGWRPRAADSKAFLAALNQSFTCQETDGQLKCTWMPKGGALGVQADLGAVTGAQASLFTRARNAVDQALILLDGLKPLLTASDPEDTQSIRTIIRTEMVELVAELGIVGGPRVPRVDQIFLLLLGGPHPDLTDPENVTGQLGLLRDRLGLFRRGVNTIDEEKVYSDFLTLVDYLNSLKASWDVQKIFFRRDSSAEAFLGTQSTLLSRELAVTSESVSEVQFALDSIFLGAAERATLLLNFGPGEAPITLAELLDWIDGFVTHEGARLIQDAGKDGIVAFRQTLARLRQLVGLLLDHLTGDRLDNPRVRRALEELQDHLQSALALANGINRQPPQQPPVNPVTPSRGHLGEGIDVTIAGLDAAAIGGPQNLFFGDGTKVSRIVAAPGAAKGVLVSLEIGAHAGMGVRPVVLRGDRVAGSFEIVPLQGAGDLLSITAVTSPEPHFDQPLEKPAGGWQVSTVTFTGTGFLQPAGTHLGLAFFKAGGVRAATVLDTAVDGTVLTAKVALHFSARERFRIHLANPDGQRLVWIQGFTEPSSGASAALETPDEPGGGSPDRSRSGKKG